MKELDQIIKDMLEEHIGGTQFFDHLDQAVQRQSIVGQLYDKFYKWWRDYPILIVSGKFGRFFDNWYHNSYEFADDDNLTIVVVNGGMRKGMPIDRLTYLKDSIKERNFVFIDDSFYSGKTRDAVKNELERLGGKLLKTFVIYDGSLIQDIDVESLYRYHKKIVV